MSSVAEDTKNDQAVSRLRKILVADDEVVIQALLTEILHEEGYEVTTVGDGKSAIDYMKRTRFDLIVTDIIMPGENGIEVLLAAKRIDPEYPVIVITGYPSVNTAVRLVNLGAADYITKPFHVEAIKATVAKVLELSRLQRQAAVAGSSSKAAAFDGLTDTYNFSLLSQFLAKEVERSEWQGRVCSLLMVEIDDFESSVEKEGTRESDELLMALAMMIKQEMRPGDIIGRTDQAEFAVILPETSRNDARSLGKQIRRRSGWCLTLSAGISCSPRDASEAGGLIKAARAAIQAAKSEGGDTILFADGQVAPNH